MCVRKSVGCVRVFCIGKVRLGDGEDGRNRKMVAVGGLEVAYEG